MDHIRPYRLFNLMDAPPAGRVAQIVLPRGRGAGGVSMLETSLIVTTLRFLDARDIFEIGTFLGNTTFNLALNSHDDARVLTLDLDDEAAEGLTQDVYDAPLTQKHLAAVKSLAFADSPVARKVRMLTGDSTRFDFGPWKRAMDFVFIDGGHDVRTLHSDTENAMELIDTARPGCVLWHDYGNREYAELTAYLDDLSGHLRLFHIEDTMLCAWFNDPAHAIVPRLTGTDEAVQAAVPLVRRA